MLATSTTRMAEIARAIDGMTGVLSELRPGPFSGSEPQLVLALSNGVRLSVLPDVDTGVLFEVVRVDTDAPELTDKLPLAGVLQCVREYLALPAVR